jgi:anti-sigma B factor antagonist
MIHVEHSAFAGCLMANPVQDIMTVDYVSGVCVVTITARELDSDTSEELSSKLLALLNEGKSNKYLLDFDSVRFMESSCFGALVTFVKWLSRFDGKIALANVSENVRFLFAVTKLDRVFPLHRDVPSALQALGAQI